MIFNAAFDYIILDSVYETVESGVMVGRMISMGLQVPKIVEAEWGEWVMFDGKGEGAIRICKGDGNANHYFAIKQFISRIPKKDLPLTFDGDAPKSTETEDEKAEA